MRRDLTIAQIKNTTTTQIGKLFFMNEVGMERCKTKTRGTTDRTVEAVEALVLEDLVPGAGDPDPGQVAL